VRATRPDGPPPREFFDREFFDREFFDREFFDREFFDREFFDRPALEVAPDLLGCAAPLRTAHRASACCGLPARPAARPSG
jgi:hypothetical protein